MEYYSAIKKNEMMPFAATWIDLEIIRQRKTIPYDITYVWNLKYDTKPAQNRNKLTNIENLRVAEEESGIESLGWADINYSI